MEPIIELFSKVHDVVAYFMKACHVE